MFQSEISFPFKARYYKLGDTTTAKQIWFVLHGYGQLAQYFIQKFNILEQHGICVIAPEALSRFYLEDVSSRVASGNQRVGATWMTKENRLMDIENYLNFLNAVYYKEVNQLNTPITVVGFSQGSATASRWIADGKIKFERLVLWAGILPPDMNFEMGKEVLKNKDVYLVYGNRDPFLNDSRFAEMKALTEKLAIKPHIIEFNGTHDIDENTLLSIVDEKLSN